MLIAEACLWEVGWTRDSWALTSSLGMPAAYSTVDCFLTYFLCIFLYKFEEVPSNAALWDCFPLKPFFFPCTLLHCPPQTRYSKGSSQVWAWLHFWELLCMWRWESMLKPKMVLGAPSTLGCLTHIGGFLRALGPLREDQLSLDLEHHGGAATLCSGASHSSVYWCTAFSHLYFFFLCG